MMKTLTLMMAAALIAFLNPMNPVEDGTRDYGDCFDKYRSGWGEECSQCVNWHDSYVVYLRNNCGEAIDVMVCVQEEDRSWKRYQHSKVAAGDSVRAYACSGTGKYLSWVRKAGDEYTVFPSLADVNSRYPD